MLLQHVTAISD